MSGQDRTLDPAYRGWPFAKSGEAMRRHQLVGFLRDSQRQLVETAGGLQHCREMAGRPTGGGSPDVWSHVQRAVSRVAEGLVEMDQAIKLAAARAAQADLVEQNGDAGDSGRRVQRVRELAEEMERDYAGEKTGIAIGVRLAADRVLEVLEASGSVGSDDEGGYLGLASGEIYSVRNGAACSCEVGREPGEDGNG